MVVQDDNVELEVKRGFDPRAPFRALVNGLMALAVWLFTRAGGLIGALSILALMAIMLGIDYLRPVHNWDTLAYLGVAARDFMGVVDPIAIHSFTYDTVREAIAPEQFAILTDNDVYRERMLADPAAFNSMLGMYDVKWLYTSLLAALFPLFGYQAGFIINCGAALLMSMAIIGWLQANRMLNFGLAVAAILMVAGLPGFGMVDIPDFLALALLTSAVLAYDRDRLLVGSVALVLAVLTRPDAAIYAALLLAVAWYFADARATKWALGTFIAVVGAYFFVKSGSTHPGWWPHVWFSTYKMQNDMTDFNPDFSIVVYATGFAWNLVRSMLEKTWLAAYIIALGGWAWMHFSGLKLAERRHVLVAALLTAIAVKFVIFPLHDGRVHWVFLFPALLLLLAGLRDGARLKAKI